MSKGRVFYTSFGHREDIWTNPKVQDLILGGMAWILRNVDADVTPNIDTVTPKASEIPKCRRRQEADRPGEEEKQRRRSKITSNATVRRLPTML